MFYTIFTLSFKWMVTALTSGQQAFFFFFFWSFGDFFVFKACGHKTNAQAKYSQGELKSSKGNRFARGCCLVTTGPLLFIPLPPVRRNFYKSVVSIIKDKGALLTLPEGIANTPTHCTASKSVLPHFALNGKYQISPFSFFFFPHSQPANQYQTQNSAGLQHRSSDRFLNFTWVMFAEHSPCAIWG